MVTVSEVSTARQPLTPHRVSAKVIAAVEAEFLNVPRTEDIDKRGYYEVLLQLGLNEWKRIKEQTGQFPQIKELSE